LAKVNLGLTVLYKRADSYHELRTVFQTVSLADRLDVEFTAARRPVLELSSNVEIPGENLVAKAVRLLDESAGVRGAVRVKLFKKIPMGGGLGGGSSDAAAILLALPALAGKRVDPDLLFEIAARIGSDVPFFLMGGTVLGMGRGEVLYPLAKADAPAALLLAPGVHIATAEAYGALNRPAFTELTPEALANRIREFRLLGRGLSSPGEWVSHCANDFEAVVFERHPLLRSIQRTLLKLGARPARMSGSGSALFGVFSSPGARNKASVSLSHSFPGVQIMNVRFVNRRQYRAAWLGTLAAYAAPGVWPPQAK
jgi:4-diphosphocytidyl-2-C-methyl-D-erythritol kinase